MIRLGLLVLISGILSAFVGCGGATTEVETSTLPPADPAAVREFVAGNRLLKRGGRGNLRRAQRRFQKAVQIDPNLWEAHYNLGVLQRRDGDLEAASQSFDAAIQIQPAATEPLSAAAEAAYEQGDLDTATERLRTLLTAAPDNLEARTALAVLHREREQWDDALEQAREVLIRDPSQVRALLEIGRVYRASEQFDVCQLVLQKALVLAGDENMRLRAEILNEQGLLELSRGDTQAAFEAFEGAIAAQPGYKQAHMNMGSVLLHAGDYAGAAAQYEAVLRSSSDDVAARVALGAALRGQGEHRRALREYRAVLEASPDHPDALFNIAVLQAEFIDERQESRETFQRFLNAAPRRHPRRERAEQYLEEIPAGPPQ